MTTGKQLGSGFRGATCKLNLVHFGEIANYKCRAHEGQIGQSDDRWSTGVWLGVDPRNGQHILFDSSQGGIRYSRTLLRLPDVQKFDLELIKAVIATPWSIHSPSDKQDVQS